MYDAESVESHDAERGRFPLVELLIVGIIVGILAGVGTPMYQRATERAKATNGSMLDVSDNDLGGKYFDSNTYRFNGVPTATTFSYAQQPPTGADRSGKPSSRASRIPRPSLK